MKIRNAASVESFTNKLKKDSKLALIVKSNKPPVNPPKLVISKVVRPGNDLSSISNGQASLNSELAQMKENKSINP